MTTLHLDFETYSAADLPAVGLHNYATHPSTGAHCFAVALDDEEVRLCGDVSSAAVDFIDVMAHVAAGREVVAHNAAFELAIWNNVCVPKYGWPVLRASQMRCTMAQAYSMALPGSLDKAAAAVGIDQRKDVAGGRVMLQLSRPKPDGAFWRAADAPEKFETLYAYCRQDVEVERALDKRLFHLSPEEHRLWVLDQKINERGVQVDLRSIDIAIRLVENEKARLDAEMLRTTGGVVGKCTEVALLLQWIQQQGVRIDGVAKADVIDALKADEMPAAVRKALLLRQEAARSSTAKLRAMQTRASADGRVRGTLQYHGASTGRWAGRGIQVQNFPRPRPGTKPAHIEDIVAHLEDRDYIDVMYGPVLDAMADTLRGMITAGPGKDLMAMDFSAIEARVLAWLAGEESVLEIFRTHGKIYEHAAAGIYRKAIDAVTKDERQIGKVAVLALGYGGGVGAFQSMARVYGVHVEDDRADQIKTAWRKAHPRIVRYWGDLESAAIEAIRNRGPVRAGHKGREVTFVRSGSALWARLPSKRVLCYMFPSVRPTTTPWGDTKPAMYFMSENSVTRKWEETTTYGGSLAENITQAVARDLLAEALPRLEANGFEVVFHAHDEAVVEVDAKAGKDALRQAEELMAVQPAWASGLPLAAEGWRGKRYRK